jgi:stearoyl-CoA desaturase (delta-9 desaturase)
MARENQATRYDLVKDFEKYPELAWLDRREWVPILVLIGICFAIDGFPGWVWGANVSSVLLCHFTFSINSFSHVFGTQRYEARDDSRNSLVIALVSFGEGWHNNHHSLPWRARLGEGPWQIDITWCGIRLLEGLRLVWDVRR